MRPAERTCKSGSHTSRIATPRSVAGPLSLRRLRWSEGRSPHPARYVYSAGGVNLTRSNEAVATNELGRDRFRRGRGRLYLDRTDVRVAPAGFEPAISALRGLRPRPLDDGAATGGRHWV